MRLLRVTVAGYRSIRENLTLHVDGRVTVLLGANDHGKSNLLNAIRHLNPEAAFDLDEDLNWDCVDQDRFPQIRFDLALSEEEQVTLLATENHRRQLSALNDFVAKLEQVLRDAREFAEEAEAAADEAESAAADLEANAESLTVGSPGTDAAASASKDASEARSHAHTRRATADAALVAVEVADARLHAAVSMRLRHGENSEGGASDLLAAAEEEEGNAQRASQVAKRARDKAAAAEAAQEQLAAGSAEHRKGQSATSAAKKAAADAEAVAAGMADRAKRFRKAAEAEKALLDGEITFEEGLEPPAPEEIQPRDVPGVITLARTGVAGALEVVESGGLDPASSLDLLTPLLPRVELIAPQEAIPDTATADAIRAPQNDFMRGIFRYAGLAPDEWDGIFEQNDRTTKRIAVANEQLNRTLQTSWSQGRELDFLLDHKNGGIELRISDPAVDTRHVRASRRSSGFTHFFALKTMLFAREQESDASAFIWLFDEPGIYLHPSGQFDLLQVLEALAAQNQAVYTTHSIFLINKNHPSRHRLIRKTTSGTEIDGKPYSGQWQPALEALGLGLPGSLLFATKVLLVEGDSDPILLNADLQKLIELGVLDVDLNPLAIMSTGTSKHAEAMIRFLSEAPHRPSFALLFDGDKGGADRRKNLQRVIDAHGLKVSTLTKGTTAEDHVLSPTLYGKAAINYVTSLALDEDRERVRSEMEESFAREVGAGTSAPTGLAEWARGEGRRILGGSATPPSSVGIAREYAQLVQEADVDDLPAKGRRRGEQLAKAIASLVALGPQAMKQAAILEAPSP